MISAIGLEVTICWVPASCRERRRRDDAGVVAAQSRTRWPEEGLSISATDRMERGTQGKPLHHVGIILNARHACCQQMCKKEDPSAGRISRRGHVLLMLTSTCIPPGCSPGPGGQQLFSSVVSPPISDRGVVWKTAALIQPG